MPRTLAVLAALCLGLMCSASMAMCGGGGMSSGFRGASSCGSSTGSSLRGAGSMTATSHRGGDDRATKETKYSKADMPEAVKLAALDTSRFDSVLSSLQLSDNQLKQVEALKTALNEERAKLEKQQADARARYDKAQTRISCTDAAGEVMKIAEDARRFNPAQKFRDALGKILDGAQMGKYRDLCMK